MAGSSALSNTLCRQDMGFFIVTLFPFVYQKYQNQSLDADDATFYFVFVYLFRVY